jgi:phospholipid/cholesterol/gamma-HCH transport system substrate-binding protein
VRRRLLVLVTVAAAVAGGILLLATGRSGQDAGRYRVDVVFDNARGLIPGQLVEVAGGRVGKIEDVSVTDDFKARIGMSVDGRFAPFRRDARCTIRPQGLIAENYVQCNPGSPDAPELRGRDGEAPTVPVGRTSQPVNLTDLFEIWNVPTRDRLAVLVSELGISTAGRGEDLSAIVRRANPALQRAQRVIALLSDQRTDLRSALDASDRALARLAPRAGSLRRLVRRSAAVLTRTGRHAGDVAAAVQRLPRLLTSARPALQRLGAVARAGTPLLAEVHRSAPAVLRLTQDGPRLARAARPTLARVAPVLRRGAKVVRRALPLSRALRVYSHQSLPSAKLAGRLLPDLDAHGFPDSLMRFVFYATLATARFDDVSHILPAHIDLTECANYATTPVAGCSANYTSPSATARLMDYLLK